MADMSLEQWHGDGDRFLYRGHSIFYQHAGSGEALLLIHGFPTASWDWHDLWQPLTQQYQCIAPDLLGFGYSDKPKSYAYSIADQANLCVMLLKKLGHKSVHLLVHDYGDTVGQELLARQRDGSLPFSIQSVCFLNGGLFPETHRPTFLQRLLASPFGPLLANRMSLNSFSKSMRRIFGQQTQPSPELLNDFWQLLLNNNGRQLVPQLLGYMAERREFRERWLSAMQKSGIPMRLIDGAADPISGMHMAARYGELIDNADIVLLEKVGHYPQVEDPVAVLKAYQDFRGGFKEYEIMAD